MSVADLDRFTPSLDRLRAEPERYFGVPQVQLDPITTEERRGSFLMRLRVDDGAAPYEAFLKIYRASHENPASRTKAIARLTRDFEITRAVHEATLDDPDLGAVRPIAHFPDDFAIITKRADGVQIGQLISDLAGWRSSSNLDPLLAAMRGVGRWLTRFQQIDTSTHAPQRLDDMLEYVDIRLHKLMAHAAIDADDRAAALATIESLWRRVPLSDLQTRVIHADYCLGNVLVDGRRVIVLDFAMTRHGARLHDLAHMHMQVGLIRLKPWFRPGTIDALGKALLEGFGDVAEDAPLFQALTILHVVNHLTKLTIRPAKRAVTRPYVWYVRRTHLDWLRRHGCLASGRVA